MQHKKIRFLTEGAMIAALYVIFTWLSASVGLASGAVQLRLSEMLCVLPIFTSAAIPGLFFGCIIANFLTSAAIYDVIFGSLATLIGAVGTRLLRKKPALSLLPPVLSNTLIVPLVIMYVYMEESSLPLFLTTAFTVGLGEILSCFFLGMLLYRILKPYSTILFPKNK